MNFIAAKLFAFQYLNEKGVKLFLLEGETFLNLKNNLFRYKILSKVLY